MYRLLQSHLHHIYLFLAVGFGIAFLLLTPPNQVPDEAAHAAKAGFMYQGFYFGAPTDARIPNIVRPVWASSYKPPSIGSTHLAAYFKTPLDCTTHSSITPRSAAAYSPLPYALTTANLHIACRLGLSEGYFIYGSRLLNLLMAVTLTWLAIKSMPFARWAMFTVALLPMTIFQTASISADSLTFSASFLFLALVLGRLSQGTGFTWAQALGFFTVAMCLALNKPGSIWLFPLFALLLPAYKGRLGTFLGLTLILIGIPTVIHLAFVSLATSPEYAVVHTGAGANPTDQFQMLVQHPTEFLKILSNTYFSMNGLWLVGSLIGNLGLLSISPSNLLLATATVSLFLSVAMNEPASLPKPAWPLRLTCVALCASMLVILAIPLFLTWTPVGTNVVHGLQGRYFIPVLALLLVGLSTGFVNQKANNALSFVTLSCVIVSLCAGTYALLKTYWLS